MSDTSQTPDGRPRSDGDGPDAALRECEARARVLFTRHPQPMWIYAVDDGRFLDVNDAALDVYGYTRQEFLAMTVFDVRPAEDVDRLRRAIASSPPGYHVSGEWRHLRKDGEVLFVRVASSGITLDGVAARLALITDLTAQKSLEAQLIHAQRMEAVGQLAGGIAHDFNNLLTVINGYTQILMIRTGADPYLQAELKHIQQAGERAARLTSQLLAFSRRQVLQPRVVSVADVLNGLAPMLARVLRENIELQTIVPDALPDVVVDPHQLEQVLLNLAINASDAMPDGGRLTIECTQTTIGGSDAVTRDLKSGPFVVIGVSDNGIGMDEATRKRIFEPFFTTKPKGRGTGLGLPTAYGILKQSGGHLTAYSEPGHGSTFRVYLPATQQKGPPVRHVQTGATDDTPRHGSILLVEDDGAVRRFAAEVLTSAGYMVTAADDGPHALLLAEQEQWQFDVLITDVVMPKIGGRAVAEALQRQNAKLRVLYMSGYTENAIVHHGVLDPGLHFLAKPFTPSNLLDAVHNVMQAPEHTLTVVVADDEAPLRTLLALTLKRAGYKVFEAHDGREAISLCRSTKVDLLLTDLVMPEQEGLETIRILRAELPHVAIVAMSGAFDGTFLQVATTLGARAVLQKPFDGRTVVDLVGNLIGKP
jgi:two-component system, cell cycle sensor histidine kinase and response regulator CckA